MTLLDDRSTDATALPLLPHPDRRQELAAFLRSRRERLRPDEVGLLSGRRRRTPGLRREEVAQLAAVGVTWYTWLEQGRPINASPEVLEAIAGALRLDASEREHLYRLADVSVPQDDSGSDRLDAQVQVILDGLLPLPASVINGRYDMLAWNSAYEALFPGIVNAPAGERNTIWQLFTVKSCALIDREQELPRMVATLRSAFGRHIDEPAWTEFIRRLSAASPHFAELWARHDVAEPVNRVKRFRADDGRVMSVYATLFAVTGTPEARMIVYTPIDAESSRLLGLRSDWPTRARPS